MTQQTLPKAAESRQYAERDAMALDAAGNYYIRHVSAMTGEGLHAKSAIAAELAWRDMEIDRLRAALAAPYRVAELEPVHAQPCGHPASLLLHSAETKEPLYCEACDDKSGRRDAEARETELTLANQVLRERIEALEAEVAGLRRDAERYRLFRRGQHWSAINGIGDTLRGEELDAAIDAITERNALK